MDKPICVIIFSDSENAKEEIKRLIDSSNGIYDGVIINGMIITDTNKLIDIPDYVKKKDLLNDMVRQTSRDLAVRQVLIDSPNEKFYDKYAKPKHLNKRRR